MLNNSSRRIGEDNKNTSSPSPKPFVVYGFVAILVTLLALGEALEDEATFFRAVMYAGVSIVFWIITIRTWINKPEEEQNFEGIDSLNRGLSRFWMRFWLVVASIGTVGLIFNLIKTDWFMTAFCALMTAFSGYYSYANWQSSCETSATNSNAS